MVERANLDRVPACLCGSPRLTTREIDVLLRAAAGMSASQTALSLHISHRTVEYHIAAMLKRIGAQNAVEAVARCYSFGVLVPAVWPPQWSGKSCVTTLDICPIRDVRPS
jgi:DNA-binding CsgD family transcriptional regulator